MPILIDELHGHRKPRHWVLLLAVGLLLTLVACAAFLPVVRPNAVVGKWRYEAGYGHVENHSDGTLTIRGFLGDKYLRWRLLPGNVVQRYEIINKHEFVYAQESWHFHPFGMSATTTSTSQGERVSGTMHRILPPLTDWLPFLNR